LLKRSKSPDPSGLKQIGNPDESASRPNIPQAPSPTYLHPDLPALPPFTLYLLPFPLIPPFPPPQTSKIRFTLHSSRNEKTNPISNTPKPPQLLIPQSLTPISHPSPPEKTNPIQIEAKPRSRCTSGPNTPSSPHGTYTLPASRSPLHASRFTLHVIQNKPNSAARNQTPGNIGPQCVSYNLATTLRPVLKNASRPRR